jgi:methylenetetrahydrofolate reductase (NADPH)
MARIADLLAAGRTFSFEFFPPKTDAAQLSLGRTIGELERLQPSFVSITYGAGGSTRQRTRDVVTWVHNEPAIPAMAHLTCVGHRREEIIELLTAYKDAGIENILALGGDAPIDLASHVPMAVPSDYTYAIELIDELEPFEQFSIGVAAHPEGHPKSADLTADRRHLAEKLRRADFAVTQFFFEVDHYVRLLDDLAQLGVHKPVIPGIMPIGNLAQVRRMATMNGTDVPAWLAERMDGVADGSEEMRRIGVEAATELCAALLDAGAPGLHLYTLNRSATARDIVTNLGSALD